MYLMYLMYLILKDFDLVSLMRKSFILSKVTGLFQYSEKTHEKVNSSSAEKINKSECLEITQVR